MVCKAGPPSRALQVAKYATRTIYRPPRPHVGLLFDSRAVEGRGMTRDGFLDLEIPGPVFVLLCSPTAKGRRVSPGKLA